MDLPFTGTHLLWLALPMGMAFGALLQRGGVTDFDKIVNQFRLRDFTVLKIMLTAIVVGGLGVWALRATGHAALHVKPANVLGVAVGASIFGVGMVLLGYCPGTGIAAMATGSWHAVVGFAGMLVGGIAYGFSFPWVEAHIQKVAVWGKVRLPDVTGLPDAFFFVLLAVLAGVVFFLVERFGPRSEQP